MLHLLLFLTAILAQNQIYTQNFTLNRLTYQPLLDLSVMFNSLDGKEIMFQFSCESHYLAICLDDGCPEKHVPNAYEEQRRVFYDIESLMQKEDWQILSMTSQQYDQLIKSKFNKIYVESMRQLVHTAFYLKPSGGSEESRECQLRVTKVEKYECPNKCSSNGGCSLNYNICYCENEFVGKDCRIPLRLLEVGTDYTMHIDNFQWLRLALSLEDSQELDISIGDSDIFLNYQIGCYALLYQLPYYVYSPYSLDLDYTGTLIIDSQNSINTKQLDCFSSTQTQNSHLSLRLKSQILLFFFNTQDKQGQFHLKINTVPAKDDQTTVIVLAVTIPLSICILISVAVICYKKRSSQAVQIEQAPEQDLHIEELQTIYDRLQFIRRIKQHFTTAHYAQFKRHLLGLAEITECTICLDSFHDSQEVTLTQCYHLFHKQCIEQWIKKQDTCPSCRLSLLESTLNNVNQEYIHKIKNGVIQTNKNGESNLPDHPSIDQGQELDQSYQFRIISRTEQQRTSQLTHLSPITQTNPNSIAHNQINLRNRENQG